MKCKIRTKVSLCVVLYTIFLSCSPRPDKVITLIGQSNITGMIRGTLPSTDDYIMSCPSDSYEPLTPGVNTSNLKGMYGLQTALANRLQRCFILQAAQTGQAIKMWDDDQAIGRWLRESIDPDTQYPYAVFCQGETNAMNPDWDSATYHNKMQSVIDRFRKATGQETKFIIVQFPDCFTNIPKDRLKQIRSIQQIIGNQQGNKLISCSEDDSCLDGIHMDGRTFEKKAAEIIKIMNQ